MTRPIDELVREARIFANLGKTNLGTSFSDALRLFSELADALERLREAEAIDSETIVKWTQANARLQRERDEARAEAENLRGACHEWRETADHHKKASQNSMEKQK